ncbi:MAG TPA: hypothetical protein VGL22_13120 [Terracidiphilus sp.]|jgi:hypothetical protein
MEAEPTDFDSGTSASPAHPSQNLPAWIKVGAVAAASALAGGLAAAWFYRQTLVRLQNAENSVQNTDFGISLSDSEEDE